MREELCVAKVECREDHVVQRGVDSSVGDAVKSLKLIVRVLLWQ